MSRFSALQLENVQPDQPLKYTQNNAKQCSQPVEVQATTMLNKGTQTIARTLESNTDVSKICSQSRQTDGNHPIAALNSGFDTPERDNTKLDTHASDTTEVVGGEGVTGSLTDRMLGTVQAFCTVHGLKQNDYEGKAYHIPVFTPHVRIVDVDSAHALTLAVTEIDKALDCGDVRARVMSVDCEGVELGRRRESKKGLKGVLTHVQLCVSGVRRPTHMHPFSEPNPLNDNTRYAANTSHNTDTLRQINASNDRTACVANSSEHSALDTVYIFYVHVYPECVPALDSWLSDVSVLKVFWDLRLDTDALYHQAGIQVKYAMDLQLMDVLYCRKYRTMNVRTRRSMDKAVVFYHVREALAQGVWERFHGNGARLSEKEQSATDSRSRFEILDSKVKAENTADSDEARSLRRIESATDCEPSAMISDTSRADLMSSDLATKGLSHTDTHGGGEHVSCDMTADTVSDTRENKADGKTLDVNQPISMKVQQIREDITSTMSRLAIQEGQAGPHSDLIVTTSGGTGVDYASVANTRKDVRSDSVGEGDTGNQKTLRDLNSVDLDPDSYLDRSVENWWLCFGTHPLPASARRYAAFDIVAIHGLWTVLIQKVTLKDVEKCARRSAYDLQYWRSLRGSRTGGRSTREDSKLPGLHQW
ncbi:hypothetical protein SARC_13476 [Sphaeroforma arctica JP610]|uniref:3'-5' exonuclease domain-containing protein n=1 Tax=Sphaeroforma arctica JP610 TaxID=667725 RepID=A0A0L0FB72_9EUKA|nr:hypothetical protein SARC_13476 [Sphaeroforma arctica JP610]KNC73967.1 hypothetical protein SARC_13476 [Sphaeroforma arctica JP610]|eukprot:XP_014147869.1 hypothetical protein SARC_13476 [Sphaeroforma arctica JP610]